MYNKTLINMKHIELFQGHIDYNEQKLKKNMETMSFGVSNLTRIWHFT